MSHLEARATMASVKTALDFIYRIDNFGRPNEGNNVGFKSSSASAQGRVMAVSLDQLMMRLRRVIVPAFTFFFLAFSLFYAGAAMVEFMRPILDSGNILEGLINGLHMGVVALAVYKLAQIVYE
jgi:hypothetical protein